jgi:hypothetical protein
MKTKIIKNSAQCLICKDVLVSESVHDFRTCTCGNLSTDGGYTYVKRSAQYPKKVLELSWTCSNLECEDCLRAFCGGKYR